MVSYANGKQKIDPTVFIADTATVVGAVEIGANSSVWFGAVIRADNNTVSIGENVNIQDGALIHEDLEEPVHIGNNVTVGHGAIVHGCNIGSDTLIGMGAILLSGCRIGNNCMVAAGSLVTGKMDIPDNSLVIGAPAKTVLPLSEDMKEEIAFAANEYIERAREYKAGKYKSCKTDCRDV